MTGEIFLTGSGGHLGSKILRALVDLNIDKVSLVGEGIGKPGIHPRYGISEFNVKRNLGRNDILVLCGAHYYKGNDLNILAEMRAYNIDYTLKVIETFVSRGGRFIVVLSSYMQLYRDKSCQRPEDYVKTKQFVLNYVTNIPRVKVLNLFLYDNWSDDDQRQKFLPTFIRAQSSREDFRIPYPDTLIDLADANSLACVIANLICSYTTGSYSLATFRPITLLELALLMSRRFESNPNVIIGDRHYSEPLPYATPIEIEGCEFALNLK